MQALTPKRRAPHDHLCDGVEATSLTVPKPGQPRPARSGSVTLVIPTHDRAALVQRAIDSVLDQDHEPLDLIVIDDGSTDETPEVLERYAAAHPERFRWSRHANIGQAQTLNRGFEMADGELVGYLSSDDTLLPGAVRALAGTLAEDSEAVLAHPAYLVVDEAGAILDTITPPEYSRVESVRLQDTIVGPGALFRRSALRRAGGWSADYRYLADFEFWLRLSTVGAFKRVERPLACWRRHAGAITVSDRGLEMARERIRLLDDVYSGEVPPELAAVRGQAYRNAFILAAIVAAPGVNAAGERYYIADSHARAVSSESGPASAEAKVAEMRRRLADQQRIIEELTETAQTLRAAMLGRHPLLGAMARFAPARVRRAARRLSPRDSGRAT